MLRIALEQAALERKIRLLSLATLGTQNVGKDLPYKTVASALHIEVSEVETWVIDGELPRAAIILLCPGLTSKHSYARQPDLWQTLSAYPNPPRYSRNSPILPKRRLDTAREAVGRLAV